MKRHYRIDALIKTVGQTLAGNLDPVPEDSWIRQTGLDIYLLRRLSTFLTSTASVVFARDIELS